MFRMERKLIEADRVYQITSSFDDFEIILRRGKKEGFKYLIIFYNLHDYDKYLVRILVDDYQGRPRNINNNRSELIYGNLIPKDVYDKYLHEGVLRLEGAIYMEMSIEGYKIKKICFSNSPEKYYKIPITDDCDLMTKARKYYSDDRYLEGYRILVSGFFRGGGGFFNLNDTRHQSCLTKIMFLYEHSNIILQRLSESDNTIIELLKEIKKQELSIIDKAKEKIKEFTEKF